MAISDCTVAIVGTGNLGGTLAAAFAAGGQHFLLGLLCTRAGSTAGRGPYWYHRTRHQRQEHAGEPGQREYRTAATADPVYHGAPE